MSPDAAWAESLEATLACDPTFKSLPDPVRGMAVVDRDRQTNVRGNATLAQTDIPGLYCPTRRGGIRTGSGDHLNLVDSVWRGGGTDYGGC